MKLGTAIEKLVENYNYAVGKEWVQDKVAWALYHTWKEADEHRAEQTEPSNSEKPNNCEHITEDGVTCAKYPACDDCLDNPLNKVKGSERLLKGSEKPNNCEYAENPSGDVWECGCFLDTYCEHQIYDRNPDGTINIVKCGYEPKDEQAERSE